MHRFQFAVIVTLLGLLVVIEGVPLVFAPRPRAPERERFEYRVEGFKDSVLVASLSLAGAEGWDLASARRAIDTGEGIYEVILKRPVREGGQASAAQTPKPGPSLMIEKPSENDDSGAAAIAQMEHFKNQMCACTDATCAKKVSGDMDAWSQEEARKNRRPVRLSEAQQKQVSEIGTVMGECMQKAMGLQ